MDACSFGVSEHTAWRCFKSRKHDRFQADAGIRLAAALVVDVRPAARHQKTSIYTLV
jgi:hypothetical protein